MKILLGKFYILSKAALKFYQLFLCQHLNLQVRSRESFLKSHLWDGLDIGLSNQSFISFYLLVWLQTASKCSDLNICFNSTNKTLTIGSKCHLSLFPRKSSIANIESTGSKINNKILCSKMTYTVFLEFHHELTYVNWVWDWRTTKLSTNVPLYYQNEKAFSYHWIHFHRQCTILSTNTYNTFHWNVTTMID